MSNYVNYSSYGYQERSRSNIFSQSRSHDYHHNHHHHHSAPPPHSSLPQSSFHETPMPKYVSSDYKYAETASSSVSAAPGKPETTVGKDSIPPEMDTMIQDIMLKLKSKGIFDRFRKECMADIDTKPAYINLNTRVKHLVDSFLRKTKWGPNIPKVKIRENMRKYVSEARYFDSGVDRIVDQVVNPKINTIFFPMVEEEVYNCMGIEKPKEASEENQDVNMEEDSPDEMEIIDVENTKTEDDLDRNSTEVSQDKHYRDKGEDEDVLEDRNNFHSSQYHNMGTSSRKLSENEPLPPGEEPITALIDSESSKDEVSPIDFGMAHTPEEEYDETRIREKESQYLKSVEEMGSPNCDDISDMEDERPTIPTACEDHDIGDYEDDEEDLEEDEEEEESPPFEKIGESPPPSPNKKLVNGGGTKLSLPAESTPPEVTSSYTPQTPPEKESVAVSDEESNAGVDEPALKIVITSDTTPPESWPIPEDVEDTPVYFLEPIPSLVEKSKFYLQFREENHIEDNEGQLNAE